MAKKPKSDWIEAMVERMFTRADGRKADRLVSFDKFDRDLGGWCKGAIVDLIREEFAKISEEDFYPCKTDDVRCVPTRYLATLEGRKK